MSHFNEQKALSIVKTGAYIMEKSFMIFYSSLEVISLLNFHSKKKYFAWFAII